VHRVDQFYLISCFLKVEVDLCFFVLCMPWVLAFLQGLTDLTHTQITDLAISFSRLLPLGQSLSRLTYLMVTLMSLLLVIVKS
jgi:hypothetical protein